MAGVCLWETGTCCMHSQTRFSSKHEARLFLTSPSTGWSSCFVPRQRRRGAGLWSESEGTRSTPFNLSFGHRWKEYCSTLRAPCCVLLQEKLGEQLRRCKQCQSFRAQLRVLKSWNSECNTTGWTASHDNHTKYRFLTEDEEIKWMMSLQDAKRTAQKNESRLCERVILKTNKEGVVLSDGNNEDIAERNYRYMARYVAIKLKKKHCTSI